MPSRSTIGFIVFVAFIVSPQAWGQQPKPLDDLTAYFVYHKLTDKPIDFADLASRTLKARQANQFTRPRVVAAEEAALKKRFEDADPQAAYVVALQTKLTYELNEGRFAVEAFEPGRVLVLDPFGARMPHPMPPAEGRQHAVRLNFLNAANARHVPLEPAKARLIDPVVRQGATGAALEVVLRFETSQPEARLLQAQAESVRFRYVPVQGFVRMANPRMWPLTQTYAIESVAPPDPATVVRPLDDLTAFFLYHKLSGEPVDFEAIAQNTAAVQRANAFDKAQAAATEAAALRAKFDAVDPAATYAISVRTNLRYDMNGQRFETDAFQPGQILGFRPFAATGGVPREHLITDNRIASRYQRRLEFANAANARYVPMEPGRARAIGAHASAIVEIHFTAADTVDSATEENKTLRAQVTAVRYSASIGRPANWPLNDPIAIAPADLAPAASMAGDSAGAGVGVGVAANDEERSRLDEWVVYFLYNKLTGRDSDLDAIAATSDVVQRAPQFEKAGVLAAEVARLQKISDGVDPVTNFWIRVNGRLHYELDQERFRVDLFDPGKFLHFNLPVRSGTALFNASQRRIAFANADALRHIPMPRDKAGAVDEIRRSGSAPFSAEVELQAVGGGDPTGAVQSDGTLRMAVRSIRYEANNPRPGDIWPFDEAIVPPSYDRSMDPPAIAYARFDIMELKTGVPLDDLRKTVTAKFGPVVDIAPSRNEDPRLKTGFGFAPDSCFAFGNKVPEIGAICVRALADERRVVRKIVVEQILEGADWDPIRLALLEKYGAMAEAARKSQTQYYGWGPEVAESAANDDRLSPHRALAASLSPVQSMMDRMSASTRVLTNLKIRMIDPDWAGSPQPPAPSPPAAQSAGRTPRL